MTNSEFSGNIILSPNDLRKQFLYASQNYGTLYAVYAQFEITNNILNKVNLYLENYKGLINIGFKEADITAYQIDNPFEKRKLSLILPVQGLKSTKHASIDLSTHNISINDVDDIEAKRMLYKLVSNEKFSGQVFDSEFHYRGGIDPDKTPNIIRNGMYDESITGERIASRVCHTSELKVFRL